MSERDHVHCFCLHVNTAWMAKCCHPGCGVVARVEATERQAAEGFRVEVGDVTNDPAMLAEVGRLTAERDALAKRAEAAEQDWQTTESRLATLRAGLKGVKEAVLWERCDCHTIVHTRGESHRLCGRCLALKRLDALLREEEA